MFGYPEVYRHIEKCALQLQEHINKTYTESGGKEDIPAVAISACFDVAIIEVDQTQIWHSAVDVPAASDVTSEQLIELFTAKCREWARFVPKPAASSQRLAPEDVRWVVNDSGELGVEINGQHFFCYKGRSICYAETPTHDDGSLILVRQVGKREFGETVWPDLWHRAGKRENRYTEEVANHEGLSDGEKDDPRWQWKPLVEVEADNLYDFGDLEGELFLSLTAKQFKRSLVIHRDQYTVRSGEVCKIERGKAIPTGDPLESMERMQHIGKYDPEAAYEDFTPQLLSVAKLPKMLKDTFDDSPTAAEADDYFGYFSRWVLPTAEWQQLVRDGWIFSPAYTVAGKASITMSLGVTRVTYRVDGSQSLKEISEQLLQSCQKFARESKARQ